MSIVTRFAPSPTGFLHIGGARTALFNWLYTRHHGGRFHLRIEDTDRVRSTQEAIAAIIDGLSWLGLEWDGDVVYQSQRLERHASIAHELVAKGRAYPCYCSPEELAEMREKARAEGRPTRYDGRWRDRDPSEAPAGVKPVIRFKAPATGETVIEDMVQGTVTVANEQLDDMVLLRADGTPTYMLSAVVDDHDMGITHVIRGDDHLTNAFRQTQLFLAFDWQPPAFGHIPLIHGPDGAKLSKRHGALGVDAYRDMGYLPEALLNYLARLGWSHGDDEIFPLEKAIEWFDIRDVGRSAARFDFDKLNALNGHYLREAADGRLVELTAARIEAIVGQPLDADRRARLGRAMAALKARARTLKELAENAAFLVRPRPLALDDKARKLLTPDACARLGRLSGVLDTLAPWNEQTIEAAVRSFVTADGIKLGDVAQPLRAALTGTTTSPGIFEVATVLGHDETVGRVRDVAR